MIFCGSTIGENGEGKDGFVKRDMPGNNNFARGEIKTSIPLLFAWVAKEDATCGMWGELVGGCGGDVWVTKTTKRP